MATKSGSILGLTQAELVEAGFDKLSLRKSWICRVQGHDHLSNGNG